MTARWVVCPSRDKEEIQSRHAFISFFQQPQLHELTKTLQAEIQRVADIPLTLQRITFHRASTKDWLRLIDSVQAALEIGRILEVMNKYADASKGAPPELATMAPEILRCSEMNQLALLLQQLIDAKQSAEQKEVVIREGVDAQLDEQRHIYNSMLTLLDECTAATKHLLLQRLPEVASLPSFENWGYEYHPLSRASVAR